MRLEFIKRVQMNKTEYFTIKQLSFLLIFSILVVFVISCEKEIKVSGLIVEPKEITLSKDDVFQLIYVVKPYRAEDKSLTFTSQDASIASVSESGVVRGVSTGKTQIIVKTKEENFADTVSVRVLRGSSAGDSIALIKLHECARGLPNWDFTKPMDQWERVQLNSNRRVVYINYGNNIYLTRPLDPSIGDLACLTTLSLANYNYNDNIIIPDEIGMLTELKLLNIHDFNGIIPPELGNLTKLKYLYFQYNNLTGNIPKELGNLVNLEVINFAYNQLTGNIPKELGNLVNLVHIDIVYNQLTGNIPKELGNLVNLESLYLYSNQLTGEIPKELGNLNNLWDLYLYSNQLTGEIPKELGNLNNLRYLYLHDNSLSGNIPESLLNKFSSWSFCPQNGTNFDNLDCGW